MVELKSASELDALLNLGVAGCATLTGLQPGTTYHFDRLVGLGPHIIRLRPAPHCRTPITGYSLRVEPAEHYVNWQQDVYGNHIARLVFPEPATELSITVDLVADLASILGSDATAMGGAIRARMAAATSSRKASG